MYLFVNVKSKQTFQQTFEPTEAQLANPDYMFFKTELVKWDSEQPADDLFEIAKDGGWDELPILDEYLKSVEETQPEHLPTARKLVGLE